MNTYQYNIANEIRYIRAEDRFKAFLKVFFGEMKRVGKCSLKPHDLKLVKNPHLTREIKVFDKKEIQRGIYDQYII